MYLVGESCFLDDAGYFFKKVHYAAVYSLTYFMLVLGLTYRYNVEYLSKTCFV